MHKLLVPTSETAKTSWNASPPSSLTIDEALRIFVEGMEFANDTQQKAIEGAFNCNLQVVLDAAKVWFEKLKNSNVPVLSMFVKPESLFRFTVLICLETEFYISKKMLKVYNSNAEFVSDEKFKNIQMSCIYMAASDSLSINRDMIKADGYLFEFKTK